MFNFRKRMALRILKDFDLRSAKRLVKIPYINPHTGKEIFDIKDLPHVSIFIKLRQAVSAIDDAIKTLEGQ